MFKDNRILQEVYAGAINVGLNNSEAPISQVEYKTFLPVSGTIVRPYPDADLVDKNAVLVTLLGFRAREDAEYICSVDNWMLRLEPQSLRRVPGSPQCLVLYFKVGLLNGDIYRVGYHVTVQSPRSDTNMEIQIDKSEKPA